MHLRSIYEIIVEKKRPQGINIPGPFQEDWLFLRRSFFIVKFKFNFVENTDERSLEEDRLRSRVL